MSNTNFLAKKKPPHYPTQSTGGDKRYRKKTKLAKGQEDHHARLRPVDYDPDDLLGLMPPNELDMLSDGNRASLAALNSKVGMRREISQEGQFSNSSMRQPESSIRLIQEASSGTQNQSRRRSQQKVANQ